MHVPSSCVLAEFWTRFELEDGVTGEGYLDPLLLNYGMVRSLYGQVGVLVNFMRERGITEDVLPPAVGALPAWDEGPKLPLVSASVFVRWEVHAIDVTNAAAIVNIGVSTNAADPDECLVEQYMVPYGVLVELGRVLPTVLAKMERAGATADLMGADSAHAFHRRRD